MSGIRTRSSSSAQGPEDMRLSLEHQNQSKTSEKLACEQAFSRAGWGEGKAKAKSFSFLAIFPQTESLFTGYWKMGYFDRVRSRYSPFPWVRYSLVTRSIDRKPRDWGLARSAFTRHFVPRSPFGRRSSVTLRATYCAPARIWLAVIDFQNGEQKSRSGSHKKRRNRLQ